MNPPIEIKNVSAYLKKIGEIYSARDQESDHKHDKGLFFRGQADAGYQLVPSIFRGNISDPVKSEKGFLLNYRDNMPKQDSHYHFVKERTEILVDMQHYEIPTRLLDWTFSPLIALYFATLEPDTCKKCEKRSDRRSKVFIFNPWKYQTFKEKLPQMTDSHAMHVLGRSLLSDRGTCAVKDALKGEFYGNYLEKEALEYPFPFVAKYGNPRIIHQSGCFTIQGTSEIPLDQLDWVKQEKLMWEIEISSKYRKTIRKELGHLFINHYSVFPDLAGMSDHLKKSHSLYSIQSK